MDIKRKVTYLDGSVQSTYGYGHWIPIPAACVSPHILDQLASLNRDDQPRYVVECVEGQGVFEYVQDD